MRALEGSLRRLRTDRIDIYFNHAVNDVARVQNPEWPEFVAKAKQQGKIRFTGVSGHGGRLAVVPRLRARPRPRRRAARRAQLRPGPGLLREAHRVVRLRRRAARAAAPAREGEAEGRRRGGDEDAARRAPQRHAPVRARRRHLRAGGLPLGALAAARRRAGGDDDEPGAGRRVPRAPPARRARAATTCACSRATRRATARTQCRHGLRRAASTPVRKACRSPTCCARACTRATTATRALARREYAQLGANAAACARVLASGLCTARVRSACRSPSYCVRCTAGSRAPARSPRERRRGAAAHGGRLRASTSASPTPAPRRCSSSRRSTRCPACARCSDSSRASAPARPTATRA